MKQITAIIQPHMLGKVMAALHSQPHFPGVTVTECQGQGRGRGQGGRFEATQETIFFMRMTKLQLFCAVEVATKLVETIRAAAHTGNFGDGVITVSDLPRVVRIRTGQEQEEAV